MRENLKQIFAVIGKRLAVTFKFADIVFLAATGSVGYGIYQIHPPSAFIAIGSLFIILTVYGRFK